jgi:hypothetical protein
VDAHESSLGTGGENGHEGHPQEPHESGEPIMAKLPRSRPKREAPRQRTAPKRTGARSRSRAAASRKTTLRPPSEEREERGSDQRGLRSGEEAPGLPRLALDGTIEAAKMPVKIAANVTFRALDALTNSLRRR